MNIMNHMFLAIRYFLVRIFHITGRLVGSFAEHLRRRPFAPNGIHFRQIMVAYLRELGIFQCPGQITVIDQFQVLKSDIDHIYILNLLNLYADLFYDLLKLTLIHIDSQRTRLLGGQNQNQQLFGCKTKENDNLNGDNLTYSRIHSNGYPISNLISNVGFSKNP